MRNNKQWSIESLGLTGALTLGALAVAALPAAAQNNGNTNAAPVNAPGAVAQAGNAANGAVNTAGGAVNGVAGQANQTVGQLGNTVGDVANGLGPTLQPVTQGVGGALNNLTQPDTVRSLLDFLSSIIPNHIEAHVNLDALRVDKVTLDIRGVDLRNLRVDLLVANSKNGPVQSMLGYNGQNNSYNGQNNGSNQSYPMGGSNGYGTGGYGNGANGNQATSGRGIQLPGDVPIAGSSSRGSATGR